MNGTHDTAGIAFAALILVLAIPFAVAIFRSRRELDPRSRAYAGLCLAGAVGVGVVNVVRAMGQLTNEPAYWTLEYSLSALFWVMFIRFTIEAKRKERKA